MNDLFDKALDSVNIIDLQVISVVANLLVGVVQQRQVYLAQKSVGATSGEPMASARQLARVAAWAAKLKSRSIMAFVDAYAKTALWSSTDESRDDGGDPLDDRYTVADIDANTFIRMMEQCIMFMASVAAHFNGTEIIDDRPAAAGHCFWLARNEHGAGFCDGDWERGEDLEVIAEAFGIVNLYIGDDGKIHGWI